MYLKLALLLQIFWAPIELNANFWASVVDPDDKTTISVAEAWNVFEKISWGVIPEPNLISKKFADQMIEDLWTLDCFVKD